MAIKRFNELMKDSREWMMDFMEDLEIDFPGTKASLHKRSVIEGDVISIEILPTKKTDPIFKDHQVVSTDESLGWRRLDLLKYIEGKLNYLSDQIEIEVETIKLSNFTHEKKPIYIKDGDISSRKFFNKIKNRLKLISKIDIDFDHKSGLDFISKFNE